MYKATQYIEKHLMDHMSIDDVASEVGYSLFHFSRLFNQYIGHSPYDYMMRRRLTEAAKVILDTEKSIMDVALDYRFNHAVSFSRAFKKLFGLAPVQLRRQKTSLMYYKEVATYDYIQHINNGLVKVPTIQQLDAFYLIGQIQCNKRFFYNEEDLNFDYKICFFPQCFRKVICYKMTGNKTTQITSTPDDYVLKYIPTGHYAEFVHVGHEGSLSMTYEYIFQTWLPRTKYHLTNEYVIEKYIANGDCGLIKVYVPINN